MSVSVCVLDGVTLANNPPKYSNPLPDTSQRVSTLGGSYIQDWGIFDGDRTITLTYELMSATTYALFASKAALRKSLVFVDPAGKSWNVWVRPPAEETLTPGGSGYFSNVTISLWIISAV